MRAPLSGILISGSSHVGKSTLAARLAQALGCHAISTDSLARHPGRPWPEVRPPVAEYYSQLSLETVYWFLRAHHENMWLGLRQRIEAESCARKLFVFEGAALRPEYISTLLCDEISGVCLHANEDFLRERMRREAQYDQSKTSQRIINKFIDRSLRDNAEMYEAAQKYGVKTVDVAVDFAMDDLFDELLQRAR